MVSQFEKMIDAVMKCVICGAPYGKCDCWSKCPKCGWTIQKGVPHLCGPKEVGFAPRKKRSAKPKT